MVSIETGGEKVRYVERCTKCGWIDPVALDGWADNAIKEAMAKRAQNIAVAAGTEPFAFVQRPGEELTFEEILFQALGAASTCWVGGTGDLEFDGSRAKSIGMATMAELRAHEERVRAG